MINKEAGQEVKKIEKKAKGKYPCATCLYQTACTWSNTEHDCVYHSLPEEGKECCVYCQTEINIESKIKLCNVCISRKDRIKIEMRIEYN